MDILFDLGASKLRVAGSVAGQSLTEPLIVDTAPGGPGAVLDQLAVLVNQVAGSLPVKTLTGGITKKIALNQTQLSERFGVPCRLENDTALVGLGEALVGAGQGHSIVVYLTISTGVGGVRIVDGQIDRNHSGFEPGHQIINYLEANKTFEDYVSGRAVAEQFGAPPKTITDPEFWQKTSQLVGYGVYNSILHWSPDIVVLGGGMFGSPGIQLAEVRKTVERTLKIFPVCPPIVGAQLGALGGLHGALRWRRRE